jgi:hypothetical protein
MNYRYVSGFFVLLASAIGISCLVLVQSRKGTPLDNGPPRILFIPKFIDVGPPAILPGEERRIDIRLRSTFPERVTIHKIYFSSPSVSLSSTESARFPREMSPGQEVVMPVGVKTPEEGFAGSVRVTIAALGGPNNIVLGSGVALVDFAGYVNADPPILALGAMSRTSGVRTERVRLWHPKTSPPPREYNTESSDPALTVRMNSYHDQHSDRIYFGELIVTFDPKIASSRFRQVVLLKGDTGHLRLNVLAFVQD